MKRFIKTRKKVTQMEKMKLIQRIVCTSDENINAIIENYRNNPGCFDTVWLSTCFGYPPIEEHVRQAKELRDVATKLRANGIAVSLQLSNSIGHGQYTSECDCSGLVGKEGVKPLVGHDGQTTYYSFCWNGEKFREYLVDGIEEYVKEIRPDYFWIDDDFRADNHSPVMYGCFCPDCLAKFNKKHGKSYTREHLVHDIVHEPDAKTRKLWIDFVRENLADLMKLICRAVDKQSPETVVCLQNCTHGYLGYGLDFIYDAIYETTGKAPWYRPGGGAYNDHNPNEIVKKAVYAAYQSASAPSYVTHFAPEVENIPFHYSGKSASGTAFETSLYLANGATDMTYSMIGSLPESREFYDEYFELFSKQRDYWEKLSAVSRRSKGGGLSYVIPKEFYMRKLDENETMWDYGIEPWYSANLLYRSGVPMTFEHAEGASYLLHPDVAATLSDKAIEDLMSKSVITDGESIEILKKRGYFGGVEMQRVAHDDALLLTERYLPHCLTDISARKRFKPSYFVAGGRTTYTFEKLPDSAEIIGVYENDVSLKRFFESDTAPYGVSSFILKTEKGGKFAVFGTGLWMGNVPSERMKLILRTGDYISEKPLPAVLVDAKQIMLLPRVSADNKNTLAVSAANLTIGYMKGTRILVRRASGTPVAYGQYIKSTIINYTTTDDGILLELPEIAPYSLVTVFFENDKD